MDYKEKNQEVLNSLEGKVDVAFATKSKTPMLVSVSNSTGFKQEIDTLTQIKSEIIDQKQYGKNIADFMRVGSEGGYNDSLKYYTSEVVGDENGDSASGDGISGRRDHQCPEPGTFIEKVRFAPPDRGQGPGPHAV